MRKTPELDPPRPVGARALKSFRDTLRPYIAGASILDLYAGHGRFGFACLEEGAASVTFVELAKDQVKQLKAQPIAKDSVVEIVLADCLQFLDRCSSQFDIVIADPPFPLWNETFSKQLQKSAERVVNPEGFFLVKYPTRMLPFQASDGFQPWKEKPFGDSTLVILKVLKSEQK